MKCLKSVLLGAGLLAMAAGCSQQPAAESAGAAAPEKNQVIETIMTRTSVRSYKATPVSRDTLQIIIDAGLQAPSAMNKQDWEVRVVDSQDILNELSAMMLKTEMGSGMAARLNGKNAFQNAPAVFFVAAEKVTEGLSWSAVDAALLSENILLAAKSMGLGTVYQAAPAAMINSSDEAKAYLKTKFGFSDNYELQNIILCGYPEEVPAPKDRDASKAKFVD